MKILFFSTYFYPYISGLTLYPWRILNHLSKKHKITVLTFNHLQNSLKISNFKFQINYLPYLFRLSKGFISPQSIIYFLKEVKKNDLIILNLPNFEGFALAFFAKLFGKKIISIYHCQVELENGFFLKIINIFLNISVYLQCLLSDTIVGHVDYINNTYIGKVFKNKIKTTFPPVEILPVSTQFINELKRLKKNAWIGYVGRIAREKGIEYLVQATCPSGRRVKRLDNVKLVFAGPSTTVGENKYLQYVKTLLIKNKVDYLFLGQLTPEQLGAFYKTIDLLVLPSTNQTEAFGMTQVEAMLLRTPVIATNLPGIKIPIQLTRMGLFVEPKNPEQITKAIQEILKNKNKYTNKKLVNNARNIFDIKKVYKLYDDLVDGANLNLTA